MTKRKTFLDYYREFDGCLYGPAFEKWDKLLDSELKPACEEYASKNPGQMVLYDFMDTLLFHTAWEKYGSIFMSDWDYIRCEVPGANSYTDSELTDLAENFCNWYAQTYPTYTPIQ
jgi:hypothetical protein